MVFLAGFIDAIAGGGGLISLPSYIMTGLPAQIAIGTNKLSSGMGTALATYRYNKSGYINWKRAIPCILVSLIGSAIGANLNLLVDDRAFKIFMLFIIPLSAFYMLKSRPLEGKREAYPEGKTLLGCIAISLLIGVYDGFYGPGTGTFLMLALTGISHIGLNDAAGITKAVNLTTNITALTVYLLNGSVILPLGLTAGAFSIAGNYIGTKFFSKKGADFVKPVVITVLVIFFVKLIKELFF